MLSLLDRTIIMHKQNPSPVSAVGGGGVPWSWEGWPGGDIRWRHLWPGSMSVWGNCGPTREPAGLWDPLHAFQLGLGEGTERKTNERKGGEEHKTCKSVWMYNLSARLIRLNEKAASQSAKRKLLLIFIILLKLLFEIQFITIKMQTTVSVRAAF